MSNSFYHWTGPSSTPRVLKILLGTIGALTFGALLLPGLRLAALLGLSTSGIDHHFYWQWVSYLFIQPSSGGIHFSFFIQLGFSFYLIWVFGSSLIERLGNLRFFTLFFGAAITGGFGAWGLLELLHLPYLILGPTIPLYACLFAWTLLNEEAEVLLLMVIPVKAKTALYLLIGASLLIDLSNAQWHQATGLFLSISYAYLYTLTIGKMRSPFPALYPFERAWIRFWENPFFRERNKNSFYHPTKIYDIRSGKPVLDDEQFMDAMLARISLYGEESIDPEDRKRMTQISRGKKGL